MTVSAVCAVTDQVAPITHVPAGTRVIFRREQRHPGAQPRLWTPYALGVGAGAQDPVESELDFTTENSQGIEHKVLPTFAVLFGAGYLPEIGTFDPAMLVHGEEAIRLHGSFPTDGVVIIEP